MNKLRKLLLAVATMLFAATFFAACELPTGDLFQQALSLQSKNVSCTMTILLDYEEDEYDYEDVSTILFVDQKIFVRGSVLGMVDPEVYYLMSSEELPVCISIFDFFAEHAEEFTLEEKTYTAELLTMEGEAITNVSLTLNNSNQLSVATFTSEEMVVTYEFYDYGRTVAPEVYEDGGDNGETGGDNDGGNGGGMADDNVGTGGDNGGDNGETGGDNDGGNGGGMADDNGGTSCDNDGGNGGDNGGDNGGQVEDEIIEEKQEITEEGTNG